MPAIRSEDISTDESILDTFAQHGRSVVWRDAQPPEVARYARLVVTKYRQRAEDIDGLFLHLELHENEIRAKQMSDWRPIIKRWGPEGTYLDLNDIYPGTQEEKQPFLDFYGKRVRHVAQIFSGCRKFKLPTVFAHTWTLTGNTIVHGHPFPVELIPHAGRAPKGDNNNTLFASGSVAILGKWVQHVSPRLPPGGIRLLNALYRP